MVQVQSLDVTLQSKIVNNIIINQIQRNKSYGQCKNINHIKKKPTIGCKYLIFMLFYRYNNSITIV